jgi:hypothetical protein
LKSAAASTWWVQVRGRAFGPYTIEQMAQFLSEGRVRPNTMVSATGKDNWMEARRVMALRGLRTPAPANDAEEAANVFVHAEILSGAWNGFVAALESMGRICEMAPGLWLVRTSHSAGVLRNTLSQTLERGDRFVVIDATRDRLAWFNLGPEKDVRISQVWNGPVPVETAV